MNSSAPEASSTSTCSPSNVDQKTVDGFGEEWTAFDQQRLGDREYAALFENYFAIFPFDRLPPNSEGFDLGCGTGRWALGVAPRVGMLHCFDPSPKALAVARRRLGHIGHVNFAEARADTMPLPDNSQDFGYSLGVLHHIPDTAAAMAAAVRKLKPSAPFLVYIYYAFDNRPVWFRWVWKSTEGARWLISRLPFTLRKTLTTIIAATVYWPLSRFALLLDRFGLDVANLPLSDYRHRAFYSLRTDALDRFGTRLEQRFTRNQIREMMRKAGLKDIEFHEGVPHWVACGVKSQ
jgi:SAM-dependent methyltransferase